MKMKERVEELHLQRARAEGMGGPERVERQRSRGKLDARARLELLFDGGTFEEYGLLARQRGNLATAGENRLGTHQQTLLKALKSGPCGRGSSRQRAHAWERPRMQLRDKDRALNGVLTPMHACRSASVDKAPKRVCAGAADWISSRGWEVVGLTESPITGPEGNVEYLLAARRPG